MLSAGRPMQKAFFFRVGEAARGLGVADVGDNSGWVGFGGG